MIVNGVHSSQGWDKTRKAGKAFSETGDFALKFNPEKMSINDYNSFLDYLQNKGVISDDEKRRVGYNGTVVKQVNGMVGAYYSEKPIVDNFADGNVLAFTRSQGSLVYSEPLKFNEETKGLYRKITAILERMLQEKG